jgi:polysaccharide export outer membrane protein
MKINDFCLQRKRITAVFLATLLMLTALPFGRLNAAAKAAVPFDQKTTQSNSEYRLSKYDMINIVVVGFSDISLTSGTSYVPDTTGAINTTSRTTLQNVGGFNDVVLGPDGYVNLPLVGAIKLEGLTVSEASEVLTKKLGEYIKIPSLAVMVKQYGLRQIYVMGEVVKPGIYALGSDYMNIFAALSSAGGITNRGRPKHISVVRVMDGKVQMREVNFDQFVKKQDASQNVILQDGDMVYVPSSNKIVLAEDVYPLVNIFLMARAVSR